MSRSQPAQARASWIPLTLAVLGVVALTGLVYSRWLSVGEWDNDEGILIMWGRLLGRGFRLYTDIWSDQPPGVSLSLAAGFRLWGETLEAGRLVILLYGLVALGGVALLAYHVAQDALRSAGDRPPLSPTLSALTAPLLLATTPNFFWLARSVSHDIPTIGVGTLAVGVTAAYVTTGQFAWLVAAGALLCWAAWLKLTAALFAVPLAAMVALRVWRARNRGRETLYALAALAAGALPVLLPLFIFFDTPSLFQQALGAPLAARDVGTVTLRMNAQLIIEYLTASNWLVTALALLGAGALAWRRAGLGLIVVGWLALTTVVLINQQPLYPDHHLALLLPSLTTLAALGVAAAWQMLRAPGANRRWVQAAALLVVVVALSGLPRQAASLQESIGSPPRRAYRKAATWLAEASRPTDFVLADPASIAFQADRNTVPWLVDMSMKRVQSGLLTSDEAIAILEQTPPAAITLDEGGRAQQLRGLMAWIKQRYVPIERENTQGVWVPFSPSLIQHPQTAIWPGVADLLGYNASVEGGKVRLTLFLRAQGGQDVDYTIDAALVDDAGVRYSEDSGLPDDGHQPSRAWLAGQYVVDDRSLALPAHPAAPLYLQVALIDPRSGEPRPPTSGAAAGQGGVLRLDTPVASLR